MDEQITIKVKDLMLYNPKSLLCGTIGCSGNGVFINYTHPAEEVITKGEPVLRAIRPSVFCKDCFKKLKKGV